MPYKIKTQMNAQKHFFRKFTKAIALLPLLVSASIIFSCSSKLMTSEKQLSERKLPVVQEMTIKANGADLYCKIIGNGRPVLFIHGGPGLVHNYFLPYMEGLLPYGYQLIFYDQRGNGKSPAYDLDSIKLGIFVEDLERIRVRLGIDKLVLFSHSSGGYLAYLYALKYPQHTGAVICCDSGPLTSQGMEDYSTNWKKQLEQTDIGAIRALPGMHEAAKDIDDESLRIMANRFYDKSKVAGFIVNSRSESMDESKGQEIRNRLYREMEETLFNRKEYQKPGVPALFIHGAEDPIPLWTIEQWTEIFDARLEVIPESNHFPFVEKTDEVCRLVNQFLSTEKGKN